MRVYDLNNLEEVASYDSYGHNLYINEERGIGFILGGQNKCQSGANIIDIRNPLNPEFISCFSDQKNYYIHDATCKKNGKICYFLSPSSVITIDMKNPKKPKILDRFHYDINGYTHQGWLSTDEHYLYVDDEMDMTPNTYVINVKNPRKLKLAHIHVSRPNPRGSKLTSKHNQYVKRIGQYDYTFQSNYCNGIEVFRIVKPDQLERIAFYDTNKCKSMVYAGSWSNFPFWDPIILVSDIQNGLYILERTFNDQTPKIDQTPTPQPTPWVNCKTKKNKKSCNSFTQCIWDFSWVQLKGWKARCYAKPGSQKPQKPYMEPIGGNCDTLNKQRCNFYPACIFNKKRNKCDKFLY